MTRCECGLRFVPGIPEDDSAHRRMHDEYANGPVLETIEYLSPIGHLDDLVVVVADATTPAVRRRQLAKVAYVAQIEMSDYPAGYDGTITEADERLFLVVDGSRCVAFVLTSLDEPHWRLKWKPDGSLEHAEQDAIVGERQKIGRVWVAKARRSGRIATGLLMIVARDLGYELRDLGWELPLAGDGRRLLRRLLPDTWLGRGDAFALSETLDPPLEGTTG